MKFFFYLICVILITNCSPNESSRLWLNDNVKNKNYINKLDKIMKKSNNIISLTFDEYKIYLEEYNKKSKYPDIIK